MLTKPEFSRLGGRAKLAAASWLLAALALPGCTLTLPAAAPPAVPARPASAESGAAPAGISPGAAVGAAPAAPQPEAAPAPPGEAVLRVLAYADRVRGMSNAELNQEVARLGTAYVPANQLQLALVLAQLRQPPELIRAQELLTRLLANPDTEAQALHPLARLLAARYGEQRRLEDLVEKQNQQTRDVQRRLDQTNERLEALKAIERSLTSRLPAPAPAASAPASRARAPVSAP